MQKPPAKVKFKSHVLTFALLIIHGTILAQESNPNQIITAKLNHFLANVADYEVHDNFWAEDLVYTSSSGVRHGKSVIMKNLSRENSTGNDSKSPYTAEDIEINIFENTAVLTFTLVNKTDEKTIYYLNSGTLLYRNQDWKVVCWQATKVPEN